MFLLLTAKDGSSSATDICVHSDIPTLCLNRQLHKMFPLLTAKDGSSDIGVLMKVCPHVVSYTAGDSYLRDTPHYMAVVRTISQTPTHMSTDYWGSSANNH